MNFLLSLYITAFLSCMLLALPATASIHEPRQEDAGVESVDLVFNDGCPESERGRISTAWDDAMKLLANVGTIDFNDLAAIEFFGPPALNKNVQGNIQAVFSAAKNFGQGWKTTPARWKVRINAFCGKALEGEKVNFPELDEKCKTIGPGLQAYTWNTKADDGTGPKNYSSKDATANIHFCNTFFLYGRLDDRVKRWKDDPYIQTKYSLASYTSSAHAIVREMMHANSVTLEANQQHHIYDMRMEIWEYKESKPNSDDNDRDGKERTYTHIQYGKERANIAAYGPLNTKILARTSKSKTPSEVMCNADNYAQYALAKYVQGKIEGYPWLPIAHGEAMNVGSRISPSSLLVLANGTNWGLNSDVYRSSLRQPYGDDLSFTLRNGASSNITALSDEDTVPALGNLEWTPDDQYPPDYIKQLNEWIKKANTSSQTLTASGTFTTATETPKPPPPAGPQISQKCNGFASRKYMAQPQLAGNIKDFCSQAVRQGVQDKDSGSIVRLFNSKALDEVSISIDWPPGNKIPFDEAACNDYLKRVSDNCDGNNPLNPMNWKAGGTISVDNAAYRITPTSPRQQLPNKPGGGCDVTGKNGFDEFWIWGNGYATWDYGKREGGLLQQIDGCKDLAGWSFEYGLGDDGREWSAHGMLSNGEGRCLARAIKSAGGPEVNC